MNNRAGVEQGRSQTDALAVAAEGQRSRLESIERGLDELEQGLERNLERAKRVAERVSAATNGKRSEAAASRERNMDMRVRDLKPYLQAVADATRLSILQEMAKVSEMPVHDISAILDLSQPLTSWHLLILKRAGLVETRKVGRQVMYRLNRERLQERQGKFAALMSL